MRIKSLAMLANTTEGKAYLLEVYGKVIENVQKKLVSAGLKNTDLSGNPEAGSVVAKRFANAQSQDYGTARAAGAGNKITVDEVTVAFDVDREFVEELEEKDTSLLGVEGLIAKRAANQELRMLSELDTAFFATANEAAKPLSLSLSSNVEDILEEAIQYLENLKTIHIDGIPRELISITMSTKWYGKIRNQLDKMTNTNVNTASEEFYTWHGVEVKPCIHLPKGCEFVVMVKGSVAQPVRVKKFDVEKIPLSAAFGLELFFNYGCKAVTPETIVVPSFYTEATIDSSAEDFDFDAVSENYFTYNEATGAYVSAAGTDFNASATYYTRN